MKRAVRPVGHRTGDAMYEEIVYEVEEPLATITLNRPQALNAWTNRMGAEVKHAFAAAEKDPRVVAIILTGAGRGFCAGADLTQLQSISAGEGAGPDAGERLEADPGDPAFGDDFRGHYTYPMSIPKPVIAAINGPIAGMAVPIALACDIRFASDQATFTLAFSKRGLIAEWGVSWLLGRIVGPAHALDLLFSSRKFDGTEAERIGLVNRAVAHDELMKTVREYALELASQCSPTSMAIMKRQVYQQLTASLGPSEKESVRLMLESFGRADFREGVTSFLEKRPPKFPRL
jgi:enoyl-CoA hydratase/carnithine racemase